MSSDLTNQQSVEVSLSNLPNDIICEILLILCTTGRQVQEAWWTFREEIIAATHVCRSWRQTALRTPLLWNHIVIPSFSRDHVLEYLARSGSAALVVYLCPGVQARNLQVIETHLHRIHEWYIQPYPVPTPECDLASYINNSSELKHLWLTYIPARTSTTFPGSLSLSLLSKLQRLSLRFVNSRHFPTVLPSFKNLTHLTIRESMISLKALLDLLSPCSNLESLYLVGISLSPRSQTASNESIQTSLGRFEQIQLPRLHNFYLEGPGGQNNYLNADSLQYFDLPLLTTLTVVISWLGRRGYHIEVVETQMNSPTMNACDWLGISMAPGSLAIKGIAKVNKTDDVDRKHETKIVWRIPSGTSGQSIIIENFIKGMNTTMNYMFYEVKVLEFTFTGLETIIPGVESLTALLNAMPSVEKYTFRANGDTGTYRSLRIVIAEALSSSDMFTDELGVDLESSRVILSLRPGIRCIELDGFNFGQRERGYVFLDILVDILSRRKNLGRALSELRLKHAYGLTLQSLDRLHSVVDDVVWDEEHEYMALWELET